MATNWKRMLKRTLAGCTVACLVSVTSARAQAPAGGYYDSGDDVAALRQRLEANEAELRQIRERLNSDSSTYFASMAEEKAAPKDGAGDVFKKAEVVDKPTFKVGGRIFADHLMITQSDLNDDAAPAGFGELSTRSRFDTARIEVTGLVNEIVDYKVQFDFQGDVTFKDVWITVMQLPVLGNVRVGHFKEPFSLDELTSSRFITFMERSSAGIIVPGRRYGIMAFNDFNENPDATWFLGGFRESSDENAPDHISDDGYSVTTRAAWLPFYDEPNKGRYLLHLGAAASYRTPETATLSFSRDPGINISGATFNNTGILTGVDNFALGGLEFAAVMGPLSIQSEYYTYSFEDGAPGDGDLNGAYVYVSYFLTGENRGYNRAQKSFDRVTPYENFFRVRTGDGVCCGRGAWEVAARVAYTDLIDGNISGSRCDDVTLGLNWYLNPYTRMMFNWVHAEVDNRQGAALAAGNADLYGIRFQVDW